MVKPPNPPRIIWQEEWLRDRPSFSRCKVCNAKLSDALFRNHLEKHLAAEGVDERTRKLVRKQLWELDRRTLRNVQPVGGIMKPPPKYRVSIPRKEVEPGIPVMLEETPSDVWKMTGSRLSRSQKKLIVKWLEAKGMPWRREVNEVPEPLVREVAGVGKSGRVRESLRVQITQFVERAIRVYRENLRQESEW